MKHHHLIPIAALLTSYAGMLYLFHAYLAAFFARHTGVSERTSFWYYAILSSLMMLRRLILILRDKDTVTNFLDERFK